MITPACIAFYRHSGEGFSQPESAKEKKTKKTKNKNKKREKKRTARFHIEETMGEAAWIGAIMSAAKNQPVTFIIKVETH